MRLLLISLLFGSCFSLCQRTSATALPGELNRLDSIPKKQDAIRPSSWLYTFRGSNEAIRMLSYFNLGVYEFWIRGNNEQLAPIKPTAAVQVIKDSVLFMNLNPAEKKATQEAINILGKISRFGNVPARYFRQPFHALTRFEPDGGSLLIINGACSKDVFNALELTREQRAVKVLTTKLLPGIQQLRTDIDVSEKYLAFTFTFGSKPAGNTGAGSVQSEFLCAVFLTDDLKKYAAGRLEQTALLSKGHYFYKDNSNYKPPIKITL